MAERLVEACRLILGVEGPAITTLQRITLCATDDVAARLEDLQEIYGGGPIDGAQFLADAVGAALLGEPQHDLGRHRHRARGRRGAQSGLRRVATIVILHAGWISPAHLVERTRSALSGRAIIEQAKGVLAYRNDLEG